MAQQMTPKLFYKLNAKRKRAEEEMEEILDILININLPRPRQRGNRDPFPHGQENGGEPVYPIILRPLKRKRPWP